MGKCVAILICTKKAKNPFSTPSKISIVSTLWEHLYNRIWGVFFALYPQRR